MKKGRLDPPRVLVELEDVQSVTSALLTEKLVSRIDSSKLEFGDADILVAKLEPELGKVLIVRKANHDWIGSTEWVPLKLNRKRALPAFLKYVFLNMKMLKAFGLLKSGKIQARLPMTELLQLRIPLPSVKKQATIEHNLSIIDKRITQLARNIETVGSISDRTFSKLYNVGETQAPPRTFAMQFSDASSTRLMRMGVRHGVLTMRTKDMLGGISSHVPLAAIAKVRGGRRLRKRSSYSSKPTGYRYLRNIDISDGEIKVDSVKFISKDQHERLRRYQVFPKEIVMAIAGTVGKTTLIPKELGTCNVTENLAVITPKPGIDPGYLLNILRSSIIQVQIQKEMSELRQQKFGLAKVRRLRIPKPPRKETQLRTSRKLSKEIQLMRARRAKLNDLLLEAVSKTERLLDS
jgi:restriction endonuclease S subunit